MTVPGTTVAVTGIDERRVIAHRRRGFGGGQSMQSPLRFGEDLIDSAALDPTIVPRLWPRNRERG